MWRSLYEQRILYPALAHGARHAGAVGRTHSANATSVIGKRQDDPVGEFGQGVCRVAQQLQQAGFQAVNVVLYPGMRHEILQEVVKPRVYHDIASWLTALVDHAPTEVVGCKQTPS